MQVWFALYALRLNHNLPSLETWLIGGIFMEKLLLSPYEVSNALGIGRTRVFALIKNGTLESVKIDSSRLIPKEAVESYVQKLRTEGKSL